MKLFSRKPKPPKYDHLEHMKKLLDITERAIKITKSLAGAQPLRKGQNDESNIS